ncbi:MAG TPA: hypothetical protein VJB66_03475 [Candidatus Nanoarchaeia archaeon]|nr:hypothetical protein [Candidatus Nanoarchaeia archaeon]
MSEELDKLKKLPAKERVKQLKELAEKKEKEKKEADELLKKSVAEVVREEKLEEQIPIPQLISAEDRQLSEEERQLFRIHRFKSNQKEEAEERPARRRRDELTEQLEEVIDKEKLKKVEPEVNVAAQSPVRELYAEVGRIYQVAEQQGYISRQQMQRVAFINTALEQKELSDYIPPTREVAQQLDIALQRTERLQGIYHQQKEKGEKIKHSYSFKDDENERRYTA